MNLSGVLIFALLLSACNPPQSESVVLSDETREAGASMRLPLGVTAYELAGPAEGQPVVLVHGVSGPMAVWDRTFPFLVQQGYRVLRYDLFGRGMSDRLDVAYDQDLFDRQLEQLLAGLNITKPVVLVGSSMGGVVVAEFQNRHPERVRKVALLDPAGFPMKTPPIAKVMNVPLIGETIMALDGDNLLKARNRSYFHHPEQQPEMIAAYEHQLIFKGTRHAMLSTWRNMPLQSFGGFAKLAASGTPTLLIWGDADEAIPFANAAAARTILNGCEFVSVPDAGHLPQLEGVPVTNAALAIFLARAQ